MFQFHVIFARKSVSPGQNPPHGLTLPLTMYYPTWPPLSLLSARQALTIIMDAGLETNVAHLQPYILIPSKLGSRFPRSIQKEKKAISSHRNQAAENWRKFLLWSDDRRYRGHTANSQARTNIAARPALPVASVVLRLMEIPCSDVRAAMASGESSTVRKDTRVSAAE